MLEFCMRMGTVTYCRNIMRTVARKVQIPTGEWDKHNMRVPRNGKANFDHLMYVLLNSDYVLWMLKSLFS